MDIQETPSIIQGVAEEKQLPHLARIFYRRFVMRRLFAPICAPLLLAVMLSLVKPQRVADGLTFVDSPREQRIAQAAETLRPQLISQRRDFHMHPELSNREERTSRIVAEKLRALGLEDIKTGVGKYGVTALLRGTKPGPVVAVRADMDALPIQEVNDVPYKSLVPNVKHACGHDAHTTIELGVAEILSKMRDETTALRDFSGL